MSSIKISELTEVTQLNSNTAKNLIVTVDLVTGLTNKMTVKNLAASIYSNNSLVVSQSITSNTIISNTITSNIITSNIIVSNTITIIQGVDVGQNTRLTVIEGTDASQNARMTIIEGTDVSQNTSITVIQGTDVTQNTRLTIIEDTNASQNVRLDYSNTAITAIQAIDVTQNINISNKVNLTGSNNQTISGNVTISGVVSPEKGLVYLPLVYPDAQTAITLDFANNSLVRANASSGVVASFSNLTAGKTVDLWITNTSGGTIVFTHGCSSLYSTVGATTYTIPATSSICASYVSFGTDAANTFVAITK